MKKIILALLLLVLVMTSVNAADNVTDDKLLVESNEDDIVKINEDIIVKNSIDNTNGTFTDLTKDIGNSNNLLNMSKNYCYSEEKDSGISDSIRINKQFMINGNGYTIDGNNQSRLFWITAKNVTLKNINFKNFRSSNGGAIVWTGINGLVENCTFINCIADSSSWGGGAIRGSCTVVNCYFKNCIANQEYGGAVRLSGVDDAIYNCTFVNCSANLGSAIYCGGRNYKIYDCNFINSPMNEGKCGIYVSGEKNSIFNCNFSNCNSKVGVAAISSSGKNISVFNCSFIKCGSTVMSFSGDMNSLKNCQFTETGYVNWEGNDGIIDQCEFLDGGGCTWGGNNGTIINSIFDKAGRIYWSGNNGLICNSNFSNMYVDGHGGSVNFAGSNNTIVNSTFTNSVAKIYGGAIYTKNTNNIFYCTFVDCSARSGSAIYWDSYDGIAFKCKFIRCSNAQKEINTNDFTTFEELNTIIKYINPHDTLDLKMNCQFSNFTSQGILIDKPILINGNGYEINCNNNARAFRIFCDNVILKNIVFKNGYSLTDGGSIFINANNTQLISCTFDNNYAKKNGGAVYVNDLTFGNIINGCIFENNLISTGKNAIYGMGVKGIVTNSKFTNNNILWTAPNGTVSESNFKNSYIDTDENDYYPNVINNIGLIKTTFFTISKNYYNYMELYLNDEEGNKVSSVPITYCLDNSSNIQATTNNYGYVAINSNFMINSTHNINLKFEGDRRYHSCENRFIFQIYTSILFNEESAIYNNEGLSYEVTYLDKTGNVKLINRLTATFGTHNYTLINQYTQEKLFKELHVINRILDNKDLVVYYEDMIEYTVRVVDNNGKFSANQRVVFGISGSYYVVNSDENGYSTFKVHLKSGTYPISINYGGMNVNNQIIVKEKYVDDNYKNVKIEASNAFYKQNKKITLTFEGNLKGYFKIYKGNSLKYSQIIDTSGYIGDYFSYKKHSYSYALNKLKDVGKYVVKITDSNGKVIVQSTFEITKAPTMSISQDFSVKKGSKESIYLFVYDKNWNEKGISGTAKFKINGKTYKTKVKNGLAQIKVKFPSKVKKYKCNAQFLGDKHYKGSSEKFTISVENDKSFVYVDSFTAKAGKKCTIKADVTYYFGGKNVKSGTVKFKINGKTYNAKIKNGIAKITIKAPKKVKKYNCKAIHIGNKKIKGSSTKFTITVKKNKIKKFTLVVPAELNKKHVKHYGRYSVTVHKYIQYGYHKKTAVVATGIFKDGKQFKGYSVKYYWHEDFGGGSSAYVKNVNGYGDNPDTFYNVIHIDWVRVTVWL